MISASEQRTALYRFYDEHENLLYVGISNDPWRRWRQHVLEKPWYPQVKHQAVTWYDTEDEAGGAEKRAIRTERPRFNIAGAIRPPEARLNLSLEAVLRVCAIWVGIPGLLSVIVIALAINVPIHSRGAVFVHALGWVAIVTSLSLPVPLLALLLVGCAPSVYRFGCWLDRNFGEQVRQRALVAAEARRGQRQAQEIPCIVWVLAPRQTLRIWRQMRTAGPRDYLQALEDELDRQLLSIEAGRSS